MPRNFRLLQHALVACVIASLAVPAPASAQFGKLIKDKVKKAATDKAV